MITSSLKSEDHLMSGMAENKSKSGLSPESMASLAALKVGKKVVRTAMKQKLSNVSADSVNTQSTLIHQT